jgi:hypothetical protein
MWCIFHLMEKFVRMTDDWMAHRAKTNVYALKVDDGWFGYFL